MITARDFLVRGLFAGLVAGILAFGVAYFVGEPSINQAISIEDAGAAAEVGHTHGAEAAPDTEAAHDAEPAGHSHGDDGGGTEVPRSLQSTLGLLTGTALIGTVLGGLAGIGTALALGRIGRATPRATALRVAATGFVVLYAVPFLIYPPNPPAVGNGDTIGRRTGLYFAMLALSVLAAATALLLRRSLATRLGDWYAALAGIGGYLALMVLALAVMPRYNEVGATFPAQLLFEFRIGSLLTQLALWTGIGVVLAELVHRLVTPVTSLAAEPEPVAV